MTGMALIAAVYGHVRKFASNFELGGDFLLGTTVSSTG